MVTPYDSESVDRLPFGTAEKAARYATERYSAPPVSTGSAAIPRCSSSCAATSPLTDLAWAEPHLDRIGALMGGPIAERAEETDKNPPRLERYDRWGHDVSEVVMPPSFAASRRDLHRQQLQRAGAFRDEAGRAGVDPTLLGAAHSYLLDQAEIGMTCALGTGGDMVVQPGRASSRRPTSVNGCMAKFASGEWAGEAIQIADRAHRRLRPRRAGDDRDARRRRVADQRVQVVRVQRQRLGVGRAGQARRRARQHPGHRDVPRAARAPRRLAATASASAG